MSRKVIIYQMLLRVFGNANEKCVPGGSLSFNGTGKFSDITDSVLSGIKKLSVSHIWYTGVIEHATSGDIAVKGEAGSPYAIKDYCDVNPYMSSVPSSRMKEFSAMVSRTHKAGMGVILDFVPNHVAAAYDYSSAAGFTDENFYPGKIHDGDWSDTIKLNYGVRDTWEKMADILLFWASKGVDGFRCDMVELVPVDFWEWCIPVIKEQFPNTLFIAEVYQPSNYHDYSTRGGFDYLYDKSGFYDTLRDILCGHRPACALTGEWQKLGDLQPQMVNFLENHDEQRIASDFFLGDPMKAMPALFVSLYFNTAAFMLYFGQEFGENGMAAEGFSGVDGRTSIYDWCSISCICRWIAGKRKRNELALLTPEESNLLLIYRKMLTIAASDPVFSMGYTFDLEYANPRSEYFDPDSHFAFLRYWEKKLYLCVANFSGSDAEVLVNIPEHAFGYFGIPQTEKLSSGQPQAVLVKGCSGEIIKLL